MYYAKKIRQIFLGLSTLVTNTSIDKAMSRIIEFITKTLECDRATVYSLDHETGLLWSQVASGAKNSFSVPLGNGIVGSAAKENRIVNIRSAYDDDRFDQSFDKLNGYVTSTILVVPIRNRYGTVEGAVQAINKLESDSGEKRIFGYLDEGMLEMLGRMAGMFLRSNIDSKKQQYYLNTLRQILEFGVDLNAIGSLRHIVLTGTQEVKELFSSPGVKMYFKHPVKLDKVFTFSQETEEYLEFSQQMGIMATALGSRKIMKIRNFSNHPDFNGKSLPKIGHI